MEHFDDRIKAAYANFSTPSYRVTPALKQIRLFIKVLNFVSPGWARRKVRDWFFSPMRSRTSPRDTALIEQAKEQKILTLPNGVEFVSYVWGKGDKVVALGHGWESRATHSRQIINGLLRAGYKVVAYDGPGHGASSGSQSDILEFRDMFFALEKAYGPLYAAIGHSLSGLALVNALKAELPVERAVIIAAPAAFPEVIYKFSRILDLPESLHQSLRTAVKKHFDTDDGIWDRFTSYKDVSSVRQPCLVIHDEGDEEVLLVEAECLAAALPNADLMTTQDLGHVKILRSKDVTTRIVEHLA